MNRPLRLWVVYTCGAPVCVWGVDEADAMKRVKGALSALPFKHNKY